MLKLGQLIRKVSQKLKLSDVRYLLTSLRFVSGSRRSLSSSAVMPLTLSSGSITPSGKQSPSSSAGSVQSPVTVCLFRRCNFRSTESSFSSIMFSFLMIMSSLLSLGFTIEIPTIQWQAHSNQFMFTTFFIHQPAHALHSCNQQLLETHQTEYGAFYP